MKKAWFKNFPKNKSRKLFDLFILVSQMIAIIFLEKSRME